MIRDKTVYVNNETHEIIKFDLVTEGKAKEIPEWVEEML